jgi:hypothetical protein
MLISALFQATFCDGWPELVRESDSGNVTTRVPSNRTVQLWAHAVHNQNVSV